MLPMPPIRVQSTCWLITSIRCAVPSSAVKNNSAASEDQIASPAQAITCRTPPIQAVRASLPRSMKRPTGTASPIGSIAKAAVMMPSQTTERSSSTAR